MVETEDETIGTCSHCGSKLFLNKNKQLSNRDIKKLLIVILSLLMFIAAAIFWTLRINQNTQEKPVTTLKRNTSLIGKPLVSIPKLNIHAIKVNNEEIKSQKHEIVNPEVIITSQFKGQTSLGGLYWILQIRNDGQYTVARPSAVVSLFNKKNQRVAEQTGWSKLSHLDAQQSTEVLVLLAKPPQGEFRIEIIGRAYHTGSFDQQLDVLPVTDFVINKNAKDERRADIVGDVINSLEYQLDFVMVMAVAKNDEGLPVGLANTYATHSSISPQGQSGFKISAGTFVTEVPASWSVYAVGSKHRGQ
jgi:hypothetical protein